MKAIKAKPQNSELARWLEQREIESKQEIGFDAVLVSMPTAAANDKKADWKDTAFKYIVTISHCGRQMITPYYCGAGHCVERFGEKIPVYPSLADVLHSLLLDSSACDMSFAEWCAEYGENDDSRKALYTYEMCQKIGDELKRLFPRDMIDTMKGLEH